MRPGNLLSGAAETEDEAVLAHITSIVESTIVEQSELPPDAAPVCSLCLYTGLYVPAHDIKDFLSRLNINGADPSAPFIMHPFVTIFPGAYAAYASTPTAYNALNVGIDDLYGAVCNTASPYMPILSIHEYVLERIPYGAHRGDFMLNMSMEKIKYYAPDEFTVLDTHIYPALAKFGRIIQEMRLGRWRFVHAYCAAPLLPPITL